MVEDVVVIATHNSKKILSQMLSGVNSNDNFLIVDTGSDTDYAMEIPKEFPNLKIATTKTPYQGYAWGAYLWAYNNFPAKNYLFLHDSIVVLKKNYLQRFKAVAPKRGIAAWTHFRFHYGPQSQRKWVSNLLGVKDKKHDPEDGVFGPIFYCNRATLDGLKEKGLLFPYPPNKNMADATERAISVALKLAGYENRQVINQYNAGKIDSDYGFFKKVFARRK